MTRASATVSRMPMTMGASNWRRNPSVRISCPRPPSPTREATLTMLMVATEATRSPAMITGTATGVSTNTRRRSGPNPIATAAWRTWSGTCRSPSTTLGNRMTSVYSASGMTAVQSLNPV
ncbi:hypothetical protein BJF83_13610 [Nocardiopsis sp. CNR-923]|nr:hypothetical protein BJF83_13610 [Nocardiopsis sp. CNR-923]